MVEEVKFLVDRKSADDDRVVFWKMARCIAKIKAEERGLQRVDI